MSKIAVIGMVGSSAFLPVDHFHTGGETVVAKDFHLEPGGKGYNAAVAAKRFGAKVSFLASVGTTGFEEIVEFTKNEGIKGVFVKKQGPTAFATILTNSEGSNQVTVFQGAPLETKDLFLFEEEIKEADVLLLNNEVPESINIKAIEIAKKYGVFVVLNPAPYRPLCNYILENVDIFTPNEHETVGLENKENLIITLGKKGALIKKDNITIPKFEAGKAIDTTGAGDTFNGVLCAEIGDKKDILTAVKSAIKASGVKVTKKYAAGGIPTKEEIEKYENQKKKEFRSKN